MLVMCVLLPAAWLYSPASALACEKCFGAAGDSPVVYAIGISMLALLVTIVGVWGGFIAFFNKVEKRGRMLADGLLPDDTFDCNPARLDDLLDKINRLGYESLTVSERACLNDLSTT